MDCFHYSVLIKFLESALFLKNFKTQGLTAFSGRRMAMAKAKIYQSLEILIMEWPAFCDYFGLLEINSQVCEIFKTNSTNSYYT